MLVAGEDTYWHRLLARCRIYMRVDRLIEVSCDVIEFVAIEFVLQPSNFLVVHSHLGIVITRLLHDLVDDQLGVTPDVEASDAQLDGDA